MLTTEFEGKKFYFLVPTNLIARNFSVTGAQHGDDLISIFGPENPEMLPLSPPDQKISDQLLAYLKNFIYSGCELTFYDVGEEGPIAL